MDLYEKRTINATDSRGLLALVLSTDRAEAR
jgi:hypothetical protein